MGTMDCPLTFSLRYTLLWWLLYPYFAEYTSHIRFARREEWSDINHILYSSSKWLWLLFQYQFMASSSRWSWLQHLFMANGQQYPLVSRQLHMVKSRVL